MNKIFNFELPENAFDLRGGEGREVHSPADRTAGVALQLVAALICNRIRIRTRTRTADVSILVVGGSESA